MIAMHFTLLLEMQLGNPHTLYICANIKEPRQPSSSSKTIDTIVMDIFTAFPRHQPQPPRFGQCLGSWEGPGRTSP